MNLQELLQARDMHNFKNIKLVRHIDNKFDLTTVYNDIGLDVYQKFQANHIFKKCNTIISFLGVERTLCRLIGVYDVLGVSRSENSSFLIPTDYPYPNILLGANYCYDLKPNDTLKDLKDRLVIDWGRGARSWHQWFKDRDIIEILPTGFVKTFPGYENIILSYKQLVNIMNNPLANRDWHHKLRAVSGIYLITETQSGQLYIGSAYGRDGILGRWQDYAKSMHGENDKLRAELKKDSRFIERIQFSILKTLPSSMSSKEVIALEHQYMNKLGSRVHGLNH